MKVLAKHSVEFPKAYTEGPLREVMETIAAVQTFDETYGSSPAPSTAESVEQTTQAGQSVGPDEAGDGRSPPRPPAQERAAPGSKPSPNTYEALIKADKLTPQQWQQLMGMAEARHPAVETEFDDLPETYFGETETETPTNG